MEICLGEMLEPIPSAWGQGNFWARETEREKGREGCETQARPNNHGGSAVSDSP